MYPHPIVPSPSQPSETCSTLATPPVFKSPPCLKAENRISIPPNKIHSRTKNLGMNANSECCKPTGYGLFGFSVRWVPRPRIDSTIAANTGEGKEGGGPFARMERLRVSGKIGPGDED
ncbi:hypothetical protein K443DRAFT_683211 [Laccaria amethystina LaAM-08-1]|uniref:Uncharacterized protein n=1 Tax=Laccaria amethystina LaAM-08-1 TaxID=1095629 RepID=A0A0C9WTC0_9AGAR|nr:hypothetical protein K443DRAFT_683211 [Laccaria amethystina LaAM-08-1]